MELQKKQLFVPEWLQMPRNLKMMLAKQFDLTQDTCTIVDGGVVMSDGYSNKMLATLTVEKMKEFVGEGEDFYDLLIRSIEKLTIDEQKKVEELTSQEQAIAMNTVVEQEFTPIINDLNRKYEEVKRFMEGVKRDAMAKAEEASIEAKKIEDAKKQAEIKESVVFPIEKAVPADEKETKEVEKPINNKK